jgi:type I restriction enzyme S subunit
MESEFFKELIAQNSDGAAIKNIASVAILKELKFAIPSIYDQRRIVARLDSLSAHVRELEEINKKTIAECDALKQALLRKVFE